MGRNKVTIIISIILILAVGSILVWYIVSLSNNDQTTQEPTNAQVDSGNTSTEILGGDRDGDGISDELEITLGTDPRDAMDVDSDLDGIKNADEEVLGSSNLTYDSDQDSIYDFEELILQTNLLEKDYKTVNRNELFRKIVDQYKQLYTKDSDGDGINDFTEVFVDNTMQDPFEGTFDKNIFLSDIEEGRMDLDFDGLYDIEEAAIGTDPENRDSDGDGYFDYDEVISRTDPLIVEEVRPLILDEEEIEEIFSYVNTDSDGDGIRDFVEILMLKTMPDPFFQ